MLNLHSFFPGTFGSLEVEVYAPSSRSVRGGAGPCRYNCGGKKFFDYHKEERVNPFTGETRSPTDHAKKSTMPSKKVTYMNFSRTEQELERMIINPNEIVSSNYPSSYLEEVYKKSELYEATKIYENPFYHEINSFYSSSKEPEELEKPAKKKKIEKKSKIKEKEEQAEEFNLASNEIQFLWNLWLLSLINPQMNERINFLIDFLFTIENPLENKIIHRNQNRRILLNRHSLNFHDFIGIGFLETINLITGGATKVMTIKR